MIKAAFFLKLYFRQGFTFVLASFFLTMVSCAHQKQAPSNPSATLSDAKPPTMTLAPKPILCQRILFLERYLKTIEISKRNREAAQRLLTTYRRLLSVSFEPLTLADREELIQALFGSLLRIEEMYFQHRPRTEDASQDRGDLYVGEFQLQSGMRRTAEAAKSRQRDETPNRSSGRNEAAQSISPKRKEAEALKKTEHEAALDLNQVLEEVNALLKNREFERAVALLKVAERKAANNQEKEILIKTRERLHAERKGPSIPPENNQKNVEEIGREAKSLLEQEKYKEAINRLNTAEKSSVNPNEADLARLKEDAVSGLINRERNRAARFFLDSKKLEDPVQKKETLFIARDILTDLILGYPNSTELSKVRQNLKVVEQALERLN